jgi:hypothetical protein
MKAKKAYWDMSAKELAAATAEFDVPGFEPRFLTPPPGEMAAHSASLRRLKRRRGRPKIGRGSARINITIERGLLGRADQFIRAHGLNRAQAIAKGLKLLMRAG